MSEEIKTKTQEIIDKSNRRVTITDSLGRKIVLKNPKYSAYIDLLEALGNNLANNKAYVDAIAIVTYVVSINEIPQPLNTPLEIKMLVRDLEKSDALERIALAVKEHFSNELSEEEVMQHLKKG